MVCIDEECIRHEYELKTNEMKIDRLIVKEFNLISIKEKGQ